MIAPILKMVFALVTLGAGWWLSKIALAWLQRVQDAKNTAEDVQTKQEAVTQNQKDNNESDALKKIDGR